MGVNQPHLVFKAFGDTVYHVGNVAQDRPNASQLLFRSKIAVNDQLSLAFLICCQIHINVKVLKVLRQSTPRALHSHSPGLDLDVYIVGDRYPVICYELAHSGFHLQRKD